MTRTYRWFLAGWAKRLSWKETAEVLVLDRFHVSAKFNMALDEVRAAEARRLERDGYEPVLKHSRWCQGSKNNVRETTSAKRT